MNKAKVIFNEYMKKAKGNSTEAFQMFYNDNREEIDILNALEKAKYAATYNKNIDKYIFKG